MLSLILVIFRLGGFGVFVHKGRADRVSREVAIRFTDHQGRDIAKKAPDSAAPMVDYTHYKVNELKDFLRKRNLPLSGTKSELIKCLTENDALTAAEEPENTAEENKENPEENEEPSDNAVKEDVEAKTEAVEVPVKGPEPARKTESNVALETSDALPSPEVTIAPSKPELTDDEFLAQFTNDLLKQIKRAERFGSDASELEARLKRVQKFGISAIRDAASKSSGEAQKRRSFQRKGNKKLKRGPRPATA